MSFAAASAPAPSIVGLTYDEKIHLARDLRTAIKECKDRGLQMSAKW
jgi:hypothetical protein